MGKACEYIGLYIHLSSEIAYNHEWLVSIKWPQELKAIDIWHIAVVYRDKDGKLEFERRQREPAEIVGTKLGRFLDDTWLTIEGALRKLIEGRREEAQEDDKWLEIQSDIEENHMTIVYADEKTGEFMSRGIVPQPLYAPHVIFEAQREKSH